MSTHVLKVQRMLKSLAALKLLSRLQCASSGYIQACAYCIYLVQGKKHPSKVLHFFQLL